MGRWKKIKNKEMYYMWNGISSKERYIKDMQKPGMPKRIRPPICKVEVGVKDRVSRLKAAGNGQVPAVVAAVWRMLNED